MVSLGDASASAEAMAGELDSSALPDDSGLTGEETLEDLYAQMEELIGPVTAHTDDVEDVEGEAANAADVEDAEDVEGEAGVVAIANSAASSRPKTTAYFEMDEACKKMCRQTTEVSRLTLAVEWGKRKKPGASNADLPLLLNRIQAPHLFPEQKNKIYLICNRLKIPKLKSFNKANDIFYGWLNYNTCTTLFQSLGHDMQEVMDSMLGDEAEPRLVEKGKYSIATGTALGYEIFRKAQIALQERGISAFMGRFHENMEEFLRAHFSSDIVTGKVETEDGMVPCTVQWAPGHLRQAVFAHLTGFVLQIGMCMFYDDDDITTMEDINKAQELMKLLLRLNGSAYFREKVSALVVTIVNPMDPADTEMWTTQAKNGKPAIGHMDALYTYFMHMPTDDVRRYGSFALFMQAVREDMQQSCDEQVEALRGFQNDIADLLMPVWSENRQTRAKQLATWKHEKEVLQEWITFLQNHWGLCYRKKSWEGIHVTQDRVTLYSSAKKFEIGLVCVLSLIFRLSVVLWNNNTYLSPAGNFMASYFLQRGPAGFRLPGDYHVLQGLALNELRVMVLLLDKQPIERLRNLNLHSLALTDGDIMEQNGMLRAEGHAQQDTADLQQWKRSIEDLSVEELKKLSKAKGICLPVDVNAVETRDFIKEVLRRKELGLQPMIDDSHFDCDGLDQDYVPDADSDEGEDDEDFETVMATSLAVQDEQDEDSEPSDCEEVQDTRDERKLEEAKANFKQRVSKRDKSAFPGNELLTAVIVSAVPPELQDEAQCKAISGFDFQGVFKRDIANDADYSSYADYVEVEEPGEHDETELQELEGMENARKEVPALYNFRDLPEIYARSEEVRVFSKLALDVQEDQMELDYRLYKAEIARQKEEQAAQRKKNKEKRDRQVAERTQKAKERALSKMTQQGGEVMSRQQEATNAAAASTAQKDARKAAAEAKKLAVEQKRAINKAVSIAKNGFKRKPAAGAGSKRKKAKVAEMAEEAQEAQEAEVAEEAVPQAELVVGAETESEDAATESEGAEGVEGAD